VQHGDNHHHGQEEDGDTNFVFGPERRDLLADLHTRVREEPPLAVEVELELLDAPAIRSAQLRQLRAKPIELHLELGGTLSKHGIVVTKRLHEPNLQHRLMGFDMDWTRIARLLDTPVDKLVSRLKRHEKRLAEWEARMSAQTKELEEMTARLREVVTRRQMMVEKIREHDDRAEAALRSGDEQGARSILTKKQDWTRQLAEAKKETDVWLSAVRIAKEKLASTRAEANDVLVEAGLPPVPRGSEPAVDPDAPRVRIKT
jgi:uncharacterized coiled-coil protein SlyX